jgi:hypothetical protein
LAKDSIRDRSVLLLSGEPVFLSADRRSVAGRAGRLLAPGAEHLFGLTPTDFRSA